MVFVVFVVENQLRNEENFVYSVLGISGDSDRRRRTTITLQTQIASDVIAWLVSIFEIVVKEPLNKLDIMQE